jgi:hypothetical protein
MRVMRHCHGAVGGAQQEGVVGAGASVVGVRIAGPAQVAGAAAVWCIMAAVVGLG